MAEMDSAVFWTWPSTSRPSTLVTTPKSQAHHHRHCSCDPPHCLDIRPSDRANCHKQVSASIDAVSWLLISDCERRHHHNLPLPAAHGGPYEGDLTYYAPGLGACGFTNTASEMICAISHILFDAASTGSNPNDNPLCGLEIRLQREGKGVDVKIVDRCVGCAETDIDVSPAVFEKLANLAQGRVSVDWSWLEQPPVNVS